jgi:hypothetical protein
MSFEKSPSLDDYKEGLPENLPDLSAKKRRIRYALGILFGLALFLGAANFFRSEAGGLFMRTVMGTGAVQGRAVDGEGSPFAGRVFVIGVDQIVRTSSDGSFFLDHIPAGNQSLVVANATTGQEHPVTIITGQTLNIGQVQFLATATPGQ